MADLNPWDRQERESPKAWDAFKTYRDLGPRERSTARVAEELGKSETICNRWSSMWNWVERAAAFDAFADADWQRELLSTQGDAVRELLESARLLRTKAHDYLLKLTDEELAKLKPEVVIKMMLAASRMITDAYAAASKAAPDDTQDDVLAILAEIRGIVHPGDE
jgi:hypothetical protein